MNRAITEIFDTIYATDLVYLKDCWKLCDAHCCDGFSKHKKYFRLIGQEHSSEIYLLPGEYQFLKEKDWLHQFGDHDHRVIDFELDGNLLKIESIVSRKPGCACEHDTRPTLCRLYPLLPVFSIEGRLIGTEKAVIFDEVEAIEKLNPICQVGSAPFPELNKFLAIAQEIARDPIQLFYLEAYRLTKQHVVHKVTIDASSGKSNAFSLYEKAFISGALIDHSVLDEKLICLRDNFQKHYGDRFQLDRSTDPS